MSVLKGECIACLHLPNCEETSVEKIRDSFTCPFFTAAEEPVYQARLTLITTFGEDGAVRAMLDRPLTKEEEDT